jgi:hypothetical protein
MLASPLFTQQSPQFWAYVRLLSQELGYTDRQTKQVKTYSSPQMLEVLSAFSLSPSTLMDTPLGIGLESYFQYRANVLNTYVEPRLMKLDQVTQLFADLKMTLAPRCPLPMNKQSGPKKTYAYFTGIINMLIEANAGGLACDYAPRQLTVISQDRRLLHVMARQVDGCFTSVINPVALWEVKEYYHTTSFGSRIADGVYETLLDGFELQQVYQQTGIKIQHVLMVDAYETWWEKGRSYLCRLIDALHMGYVDEILFGLEVTERLPIIVPEWVHLAQTRSSPP